MRSLDEIQTAIKADIRTYPSLNNYLFPEDGGSNVSVFNLFIFVASAAIFTFEALIENLKTEVQTIADSAPSGNASWLRQQILNFQLGDAITINTTDATADDYFVPKYATIDEAKQIITRCAITDSTNGSVNIKVAKGTTTLEPLTASEQSALSNYYNGTDNTQGIGFAGVNANIISLNPDRIRVEATVYYLGQFVDTTVKANVITAIENYLATFTDESFGGTVFMSKLVDAVQAVDGVSRISITDVKTRDASTALGSAATLDIQGIYETVAGYIISEDETSNTLDDTITMTEEV